MTARLDFLKKEIQNLKDQSLYADPPILSQVQDPHTTINGKKIINFAANNYLGLANHPRIKAAAKKIIDEFGFGTSAVRQITGNTIYHEQLEEMLAKYKHTESSLVFPAGIAANRGTIQALMGKEDVIISDALNHGSIIDGVRLAGSEKKVYAHNDVQELEKALKESTSFRRRMIVTDGVFSMDGDIAPLKEIVELAEKYNAITMVDDAHGDGVLGKNGRGIVDHLNLHGRVDIDMGTFSKAFGGMGGYVAGDTPLRDYLKNTARSFIFTTAHPLPIVAANLEALKIVQEDESLIKRLWENTRYFKERMQEAGFDLGKSETPIVPVMVGESRTAVELAKKMFEQGVFVKPIVFPLVAKDKARIRVIITAAHSREDMDHAIQAFIHAGKEMKIMR